MTSLYRDLLGVKGSPADGLGRKAYSERFGVVGTVTVIDDYLEALRLQDGVRLSRWLKWSDCEWLSGGEVAA